MVGIAAAPDFTEDMMLPHFDPAQRDALARNGVFYQPSAYSDEPYPITRKLIDEARDHLLLRSEIALDCPIRLLQGMADPDVPWRTALKIAEQVRSADVRIALVKDGDHRLSRDGDLALLTETVDEVTRSVGGVGPP